MRGPWMRPAQVEVGTRRLDLGRSYQVQRPRGSRRSLAMAALAFGPERADFPGEDMQHVPDLARRDVLFEDLEDGPGDTLREGLGMALEGGGSVL